MALYVVQSKKPGHLSLLFNTDSPKDAFMQFINYTDKDKCNGIVIEECDVSKSQFDIYLQVDSTTSEYVTSYRLSRPSLNIESLILRQRLANTLIPSRNEGCFFIPIDAGTCIYYIPDNCNNLFHSISDDLNKSQLLSSIKTLKVVGGRTVQDCNTFFQGLEIDCLDLTEFYAPLSVSWARAFELSRINTIKGLQNQSFANVRDMDRAFYKSKITKVDLHGQDFRKVNKLSSCFGYSVIGVLNLHDVKLKDLYDMSYMFQDATILSGLDLSRFIPPDKQLWCARMFKGLASPYLDISTWVKHKYCIYTSMFEGCKLERLKTKNKSPFIKQYKEECSVTTSD